MASMLARISAAFAPTLRPVSWLASARARLRASTCMPSTFDDAIDSVRRSRWASGMKLGPGVRG